MAKTFLRPTLEGILDEIVGQGIYSVQFSLSCAGLPELPGHIDPDMADRIKLQMDKHGIEMAAVCGLYNMIHPDEENRREGLRRLRVLAANCERLGTSVVALCTGTRDPDNMWRRHPGNDSTEAWQDLVDSMREALEIAERYRVTLAFEPEVSNVVDSVEKGRRLLAEMDSPYLKVVMDPANIFHRGELPQMREKISEAFSLLGDDIVIAHAKDLDRDGEAGHLAAGKGLLDYDRYLSLLNAIERDIPLILHGLGEDQVEGCVSFLQKKMGNLT
jgi:sugar phosphate isomerase/epimerase